MSDILSQEEIEALLNSLSSDGDAPPSSGGSLASSAPLSSAAPMPAAGGGFGSPGGFGGFTPASRAGSRATVAYEVYDFRRPDKFSKEQLRTLQMLHETFGRLASTSLSAYLRSPVQIDLISLEQVPYEEYLRSINASVFTIMSMPPLTGQAVLEIEFAHVFSMIDRLLGGPGKGLDRTVLTDIERPLVKQFVERMFVALKSAWEGVVIINPGIETIETSAQFVQIAPPNDIVVTILFEVKIGQQRGAMSLCIPYVVLKPITSKLSAQKWFNASAKKASPHSRRALSLQVQSSSIDCSVELGKTSMSVRELLALRKGDVLRLDQKVARELTMTVGSIPKFAGRPMQAGKNLVFSVTGAIAD